MNHRLTQKNLLELSGPEGLKAKLSAPKVRKKRNNEESKSQKAVVSWWRSACTSYGIPSILLFAIPNGSALGHGKEEYQIKQRQIRGKTMKDEGLTPGVFDLFLSVPRGEFHGCYIEMKAQKGETSSEQDAFYEAVTEQSYKAFVCRSYFDAITVIKNYLA